MRELEQFRKECTAFFDSMDFAEKKPLVFGDGMCEGPLLMLIGEAPGEKEALLGKPFVGKAGKNLDEFLLAVGLSRDDIYISNVVKLRPTKQSAAGRTVNRPPTREEKALFTPWLMREISIVKPSALVTLGNVALQAFLPKSVGELHGGWSRAVVSPPEGTAFTLPLFSLYHPASVIYNRALGDVYREDLRTLRASLFSGSIADRDS